MLKTLPCTIHFRRLQFFHFLMFSSILTLDVRYQAESDEFASEQSPPTHRQTQIGALCVNFLLSLWPKFPCYCWYYSDRKKSLYKYLVKCEITFSRKTTGPDFFIARIITNVIHYSIFVDWHSLQ